MDGLTKTIQNKALAAFGAKASDNVLKAIHKASAKTGVNFAYMVQQAAVESSFDPKAKAKTSSASGLYQFLSSTWMDMIDKYGDKYGIDADGMSKKQILALRSDPEISANMAAEFASENERYLNDNWGGEVGSTELYLAHFMGAGGATAFLKAKDKNPLQPAADIMPQAARSNRNVFFDKSGRAKSIDEVYAFFDKKFAIKDSTLPALNEKPSEAIVAQNTNLSPEQQDLQSAEAQALIATSSIFNTGRTNEMAFAFQPSEENNAVFGQIPGSYQNLLRSPIDLMMLTQLSIPGSGESDKSLF